MHIPITSKLVFASLVVVLAGAGCATGSKNSTTTPYPSEVADRTDNTTMPSQGTDDDHGTDAHAILAGSRISLDNAGSLEPGNVDFTFKLYGLDGHEFGPDDLKIAHEKKMHFIVVRDDMTGFQHVHPEYTSGKWTVSTTIVEQGNYQVYVDIEPVEEEPTTLRIPVTIGGTTENAQAPTPKTDMSVQSKGITAVLETSSELKTNEHTRLTFALTKGGSPVADIGPYLGAFGHVVLLRHGDADDFIHVHPVTETAPTDGKVSFDAQFPVKGRYTLYAQFNVNGEVLTFPITVDVDTDGSDTEVHDDGMEPSMDEGMHHGS